MSSSRIPPPSRPNGFVSRVYNRDLRPVVICLSVITAIWSLFESVGFFRSISIDRQQNQDALANISIALGAAYMVICLIEAFGTFAVTVRKTPLVRIYTFATTLSALFSIATGLARVVVHFVKKNALISECSNITSGDEVLFRYGWFGPTTSHVVSQDEADEWCRRAWDHDSVSEIVSLLIIIVLALFFCTLAFAYYRQLMDPTSPANVFRTPGNQPRMDSSYPNHYNPAYGAGPYGYNLPYAGGPAHSGQFAPPAGVPPESLSYQPKGYGVGTGDQAPKKDENPFADFDDSRSERDVTTRPTYGQH
jgi:hypothetical protein